MQQFSFLTTFKILVIAVIAAVLWLSRPSLALAQEVLGVHILQPDEIEVVESLLLADSERFDEPFYLTIPFTLQDISRLDAWQKFFDTAKDKNIIPLVRLATITQDATWKAPTQYDVVRLTKALNRLDWPQESRHIIVFNEPNHAKEWSGTLDPEGYAKILQFTADWLHTEKAQYVVLPGAMDLAAPNSSETMEAFNFWQKVLAEEPEVFNKLDAWNSHSYPNPGFRQPPYSLAKNNLRGYQHELTFVEKYTDKSLPVYITETGWDDRTLSAKQLNTYYEYAFKHIWNDERIVAVTPFVLRGAPGPFEGFSFLDAAGEPTKQFLAFERLM